MALSVYVLPANYSIIFCEVDSIIVPSFIYRNISSSLIVIDSECRSRLRDQVENTNNGKSMFIINETEIIRLQIIGFESRVRTAEWQIKLSNVMRVRLDGEGNKDLSIPWFRDITLFSLYFNSTLATEYHNMTEIEL